MDKVTFVELALRNSRVHIIRYETNMWEGSIFSCDMLAAEALDPS